MLERVGVFLLSMLLVFGSLGLGVWLIAAGQVASVDGIFLLLVCLVFALVFAICAYLVIQAGLRAASAAPPAAKTASAPAAKTSRPELHTAA